MNDDCGKKDIIIDTSAIIKNSTFQQKAKIWKNVLLSNSEVSNNVSIGDFSRIENSELHEFVNIQRNNVIYSSVFGRYTYTGRNTTCWNSIIGAFCSISWNVSIGGANHDYKRITTSAFLYSDIFDLKTTHNGYNRFNNDCTIGNDVWIGCGAVICRNVKVGDGAVIAANAVVTKDVQPYSIVAGVPAKHIKFRFDKDIIDSLLDIKWWEFPKDIIIENYELFNSNPTKETLSKLENIRKEIDKR